MELNKALFVDLDGTLIITRSGRKFPIHSEDWKLIPETVEAIKYYYKKDYKIIIVSNQGGIEEGYLDEKVFTRKIEQVCSTLEKVAKLKKNSIIYYYCKEMESYNRKPNPGMGFEAAVDYELSLSNSIMLGDFASDEGFAKECGMAIYHDIDSIKSINWGN